MDKASGVNANGVGSMTKEQCEVARLLCLGETKRAIGLRLGLSHAGVDGRLRRAYQATGAQCQIELGMWCVAHGIVTVPELQEVYCATSCGDAESRRGQVDQRAVR